MQNLKVLHFTFAPSMTYNETIDYMYTQLPMFTRIGAAAYKKDLTNTITICHAIGNPQQHFKSIHIAGTNGKGSTSHMLAAIFQTAGYKTGLYTSPHLKDFRERIKINGEWIAEDFVVDFVTKSRQLIADVAPSFFELTVAMAFDYFAKEQVDIAIIETGLGGRLDSTNIIVPELSIITNIGWDHMNLLGDTLEKIASEKAGIIKRGIPVIIGETLPETKAIFETIALEKNAPILFAEAVYSIHNTNLTINNLMVDFTNKVRHSITVQCDLSGIYQQKNIRTVLAAIVELKKKGYDLKDETITTALQQVKRLTGLHGRWEVIRKNPYVVLDVGHNEDGIKQILDQLKATHTAPEAVRIVIGMVRDKEVEKVLQLFPSTYHFYFTNAHTPRAMPASALKEKAKAFSLAGEAFDDVNEAIRQATEDASPQDLIIVCGSVFVVGEVATDF